MPAIFKQDNIKQLVLDRFSCFHKYLDIMDAKLENLEGQHSFCCSDYMERALWAISAFRCSGFQHFTDWEMNYGPQSRERFCDGISFDQLMSYDSVLAQVFTILGPPNPIVWTAEESIHRHHKWLAITNANAVVMTDFDGIPTSQEVVKQFAVGPKNGTYVSNSPFDNLEYPMIFGCFWAPNIIIHPAGLPDVAVASAGIELPRARCGPITDHLGAATGKAAMEFSPALSSPSNPSAVYKTAYWQCNTILPNAPLMEAINGFHSFGIQFTPTGLRVYINGRRVNVSWMDGVGNVQPVANDLDVKFSDYMGSPDLNSRTVLPKIVLPECGELVAAGIFDEIFTDEKVLSLHNYYFNKKYNIDGSAEPCAFEWKDDPQSSSSSLSSPSISISPP